MLRPLSKSKEQHDMTTTCSGQHWPSELTVSKDPVSGATVRQLTHYRAHSNQYIADPQAYGQVYIVDVPEWDALPDRE